MNRRYSEDLKDRVRAFYLSREFPPKIKDLARISLEVFGIEVDEETLKDWKRYDPEGDWNHLWQIQNPPSVDEEVTNVRRTMYRLIMDSSVPAAARASAARVYETLLSRHGSKEISAKTPADVAHQIVQEEIRDFKAGTGAFAGLRNAEAPDEDVIH